MKKTIITTCDLHEDYDVIGPVYFQISNYHGIFSGSKLDEYEAKYAELSKHNEDSDLGLSDLFLTSIFELGVGSNRFKTAFYIATEELKKQAEELGGDAVIGMRQDIDIDSNGFQYFYLQMYGTAVKRAKTQEEIEEERKAIEEKEKAQKEKIDALNAKYNCDKNHDFKIPMKPIYLDQEIKCPICKTLQRKDRTVCWNCGQAFIKD